jgi:hypothetical protein
MCAKRAFLFGKVRLRTARIPGDEIDEIMGDQIIEQHLPICRFAVLFADLPFCFGGGGMTSRPFGRIKARTGLIWAGLRSCYCTSGQKSRQLAEATISAG